jgi:hypothetical protein
MVSTVSEIDYQADQQPNNEPGPIHPAKLVHHVSIKQDAKDWHYRDPRGPEWARLFRIFVAQHKNCNTNNYECKQGTDIHHLPNVIDGGHASDSSGQQSY